MATKSKISPTSFAALPAIGTNLEGGIFAGITTRPDGTHCAVILLSKAENDLNWKDAKAWAKKQGGELPTRPIAALLFANVKPLLSPTWHWTSDEYNASYAWHCTSTSATRAAPSSTTSWQLLPSAAFPSPLNSSIL